MTVEYRSDDFNAPLYGTGRERVFGAASIALLVMGIATTAISDLLATCLGIDRELAFNVSLPASTCLVTAVIFNGAFPRMREFTCAVLTFCEMSGYGALELASILLPRGAIPLAVKLAYVGHVVGWFIALITSACTDRNRSYRSRWVQIVYETPRPASLSDAIHSYVDYRAYTDGVAVGFNSDEIKMLNEVTEKSRTCPGCQDRLWFSGFAIRNGNHMTLPQLAKIWLDDRVVLHCCECFDSWPDDDLPLTPLQTTFTDVAGNPVDAGPGPTCPYDVQIENVTAPPVAIDMQGRVLHEIVVTDTRGCVLHEIVEDEPGHVPDDEDEREDPGH